MSLTKAEIGKIIKEFSESLNIKNLDDNAEYFEIYNFIWQLLFTHLIYIDIILLFDSNNIIIYIINIHHVINKSGNWKNNKRV